MNCKVCSSSENVLMKKIVSGYKMNGSSVRSKFSIFRCLNCDIMWAEPVLGQDILLECYDREYYETYSRNADYKKMYFENRLNELELHTRRGKVLDIGCGDGFFLYLARERGWESRGVEASLAAVGFAVEKYKVDVFYGPLEKINSKKGDFNLITLWNVLEHMDDPLSSLDAIRDLLQAEGILAIETPNYRNIWFKYRVLENALFGADGLDIPGHRQLFTPNALRYMLNKAGFDIIDFEFMNYGLIRHETLWPDARLIKRLYFRLRNAVKACCNFLSTLFKNGDHMKVICRKRGAETYEAAELHKTVSK